jgi:hypothetical protein
MLQAFGPAKTAVVAPEIIKTNIDICHNISDLGSDQMLC